MFFSFVVFGFPMVFYSFWWFSHWFLVVFPKVSSGFSRGFSCFPLVVTMGFLVGIPKLQPGPTPWEPFLFQNNDLMYRIGRTQKAH